MKLKSSIIAATAITMLISCKSTNEIVIADFESETYQDWTIEGEAFGNAPVTGSLSGQQSILDYQGNKLANSFHNGGDSRGTITSPAFEIEKEYINFLLGGGKSSDLYVELIVDGQTTIRTTSGTQTTKLYPVTWEVSAYRGKTANIKIVDNKRGNEGYILVDHIVQSDKPASMLKTNYKLSYPVNSRYILIPIQEDAPELRIALFADNTPVGHPQNIRFARTHTDYFVPIKVEAYKGQNVDIVFEQMDTNYSGLSQISQSDTFDFDHNEKYRPVYHFSPEYGWTNDPNGMVYHNGEYHLFYQHNPYGSMWGNMSWGHAVSRNLTQWEHLPVAILPDSLGTIFSGSAVIDRDNTAGFGKDALIAIYTSDGADQTQSIAYSHDNGRTFTTYKKNPVLRDEAFIDFRDPKVFWYAPQNKWVMSLATTQTITFYSSKDLKSWAKLSEFGDGIGAHGGVWECPDLFPLSAPGIGNKWVLFVSINPGGPNGGSATQYFIGNFDGTTFTPDALPYPLWLDYGRDNYAGVTWNNIPATDGRRIFIGWMSNWDYTNQVPTTHFRNAMTLPREITLINNGNHLALANYPLKEIFEKRGKPQTIDMATISGKETSDKLSAMANGTYEIEMTIEAGNSKKFGFRIYNEEDEEMIYTFNTADTELTVDRRKSGNTSFNSGFASIDKAPLVVKNKYKVNLFIDKASSELFINNGETVQTQTMFPSSPYNRIEFFADDAEITPGKVAVYPIN